MGITTNLALNRPTMSSSYVKPYVAANAVNGTLTPVSRWLCNTLPGWMCVDLGNVYWINRWVVRHMSVAGWRSPDYNMTDFVFQGSTDNVRWNNLDSVAGNLSAITDRTITPACVRYVRVYVTKGLKCNPQLASIMEFEVYPAPSSQFLTGITLSSGTLSPVPFSGRTTFAYTASVGYDVTNITLTPVAEDANATIKVNGVVVQNNTASGPIALNVGANAISVQVTGSDGLSQATYTVTVTRAGSQYLSALALSNGTLNPAFAGRATFAYTASVDNSVSTITVTATPESSSSTVNITCGTQTTQPFALSVGSNTITVVVTDTITGAHQQYTVTVTRAAGADTNLSALSVLDGTTELVSGFIKTTLTYSANVGYDTTSVVVTPTPEDPNATVTVNGGGLTGGKATVTLSVGPNDILVVVTSGSNSTTYKVTVTRASTPYLAATGGIVVGGSLGLKYNETYSPTTYAYTITNRPANTTTITVKPTAADTTPNFMITVRTASGFSMTAASGTVFSVPVNATGGTTITVTVNSRIGVDQRNYVIKVN